MLNNSRASIFACEILGFHDRGSAFFLFRVRGADQSLNKSVDVEIFGELWAEIISLRQPHFFLEPTDLGAGPKGAPIFQPFSGLV